MADSVIFPSGVRVVLLFFSSILNIYQNIAKIVELFKIYLRYNTEDTVKSG